MDNKLQNSIATDSLYREYNWYNTAVPALVQKSCDEFFDEKFKVNLIGVSQNINCLIDNEACFVTKIRINHEYDMFFRLTDKAIDIILNLALGPSKNKFNINKISELETEVITSFNDFMFEHLKTLLKQPESAELKRTNFDLIHLTFIIKEAEKYNQKTGKVIVTLPKALLTPTIIEQKTDKFSEEDFPRSRTIAKFIVAKNKFPLFGIKNLEVDDVVVFENSNIDKLTLVLGNEILPVQLNPNMSLIVSEDNDGGDEMAEANQNIWDSIEVEMSAEFDAVKVTLGELKKIEEGLVVDITSLYENNVVLKVEDKPIASGQLVIVNDRYGVKINNVIADGEMPQNVSVQASDEAEDIEESESEIPEEEQEQLESVENEDEEFDYSDFELEDDNI